MTSVSVLKRIVWRLIAYTIVFFLLVIALPVMLLGKAGGTVGRVLNALADWLFDAMSWLVTA